MMNPAEFENIARFEREFWWHRGMEQILYRVLDPITGNRRIHRGLEVGCGTGYMSAQLERRYGWRMFPTDLGHEGLLFGLQNGFHQNGSQADVAALPFPTAAFDLVAALDIIVHFPRGQEYRAIRDMARVLKPGGLLVLRTSALDILRSRHSEFTHERQRFDEERLRDVVTREGIHVLRCTYANSLLLPIAFTKFRLIEPLFRTPPSSGIKPVAPWLNSILYSALQLESKWLAAGHNLPLGQSLILIGERLA